LEKCIKKSVVDVFKLDNGTRKFFRKWVLGRANWNDGNCGIIYWEWKEKQFNMIKKQKWKLTDNVGSEPFEIFEVTWRFSGDRVIMEDDWQSSHIW